MSRETYESILDESLQDPDGVMYVVADERNGTLFWRDCLRVPSHSKGSKQ